MAIADVTTIAILMAVFSQEEKESIRARRLHRIATEIAIVKESITESSEEIRIAVAELRKWKRRTATHKRKIEYGM